LLDSLKQENIRILDIGGTWEYWDHMGFDRKDCHITLLNLELYPVSNPNFDSVIGDATNLSQYQEDSFDVIYSNSVIEHLFTFENQQRMANEIMRVGKNYFVQSPNYWFPIEPHWFFPFFQYFPQWLRIEMTHKLNLGFIGRKKDKQKAIDKVKEVRLLSKNEMRDLFPQATIWSEKFYGFHKSFVAYFFSAK
jgi:Methyltransferase domain